MRRTFYPNTCLWLAVAFVFSFTYSSLHAQSYRILTLGNSITDGITQGDNPTEPNRIGYRKELYTLLNNAGYSFDFVGHNNTGYNLLADGDNGGIPGTRGPFLIRLLKDGFDLRWGTQTTPGGSAYLDTYPADIILLHIGTNDILPTGSDASAITGILDEIDSWEARTGTHVTVFVARIINKNPYNPTITDYNNHLISLVSSRGDPSIFLVDMETGAGINYSTEIGIDGIHPTQAAYDKIGQTWYIHLNSFLSSIPALPDQLSLHGSESSIDLSWNDNSSNETGFEIERSITGNPGSFELVHTTASDVNYYTDKDLTKNTRYYYRIRAINLTGPSLYTAIEDVFTTSSLLIAPSGLIATTVSSNSIELLWEDNSDSETGFMIERSLNAGTGFSPVSTANANETSYTDTGLIEGTEYVYRVRATDGFNTSVFSNEHSAITRLIPPSRLAADAVDEESILLTWTDNSANESAYTIERSMGNGFEEIHVTSANSTFYTDQELSDGIAYFYRIRASNEKALSDYSLVASAATPLIGPSNLTALPVDDSAILLYWSDNTEHEGNYTIERSANEASGYSEISHVPANQVSFEDGGLDDGRLYFYRVRATNDQSVSVYSNVSGASTFLATPTELSASAVNEDTIIISWMDNSGSEDAYLIERSSGVDSDFTEIQSVSAGENMYTDKDLVEGTEYFYRVRAKRGIDYSGYSNSSHAITNLATPTELIAQMRDHGRVELTWVDNSDKESAYVLERSERPGTDFSEISFVPADSEAFVDTENSTNITYYYRIKATNGLVFSDYSNEAIVVPSIPLTDSLFSFYPNPNKGNITVVIGNADEPISDFYLRLTDFSGKIHFICELKSSGSHQTEIFHLELPQGMQNGFYSLSLIFENNSVTEKFILMK